MNAFIRSLFTLSFIILLVTAAAAGNGGAGTRHRASPDRSRVFNSNQLIRTVDSFLNLSVPVFKAGPAAGEAGKTGVHSAQICSCQILNLSSSNYDHRHLAVLAEKTNNGSPDDFDAAKKRIEKEKKHLKKMFYDRVEVIASSTATGSCHAMYVQLKSGDSGLQIYEILNADIR